MSLKDELLAVRAEYGALTAANLVEAAEPETHPLHDRFEWDDSIAGPQYRLHQAKELIRSVRVVFTASDGPTTVRSFMSVERDVPGRVYEPTEEIAIDPVAREVLLKQMRREFREWKKRYEHMAEFLDFIRDALAEAS